MEHKTTWTMIILMAILASLVVACDPVRGGLERTGDRMTGAQALVALSAPVPTPVAARGGAAWEASPNPFGVLARPSQSGPRPTPPAGPLYRGEFKHVDQEAGYAFWLPRGWCRGDLPDGRCGVLYSPYAGGGGTFFMAEARPLAAEVSQEDAASLRGRFQRALGSIPGVRVEWESETIGEAVMYWEAHYTFEEGHNRPKCWVRTVYLGKSELTFLARGAAADEFEYWLPMFFNTMMTIEL